MNLSILEQQCSFCGGVLVSGECLNACAGSRPTRDELTRREYQARAAREYWLAQLMFAGRDLALHQFTRGAGFPVQGQILCAECRYLQQGTARDQHDPLCRTGRVLRLIDALVEGAPIPTPPERKLSEDAAYGPLRGVAGELPRALPESIALGYERIHEITERAVARCRAVGEGRAESGVKL